MTHGRSNARLLERLIDRALGVPPTDENDVVAHARAAGLDPETYELAAAAAHVAFLSESLIPLPAPVRERAVARARAHMLPRDDSNPNRPS